jgi:hypothetical protein
MKRKRKNKKQNQRLISFLSLLSSLCAARASGQPIMLSLFVGRDVGRNKKAGDYQAISMMEGGQALRYPTGSVIALSSQASMNPSSKAPSSKAKTKGMSSVDFIRPMRET